MLVSLALALPEPGTLARIEEKRLAGGTPRVFVTFVLIGGGLGLGARAGPGSVAGVLFFAPQAFGGGIEVLVLLAGLSAGAGAGSLPLLQGLGGAVAGLVSAVGVFLGGGFGGGAAGLAGLFSEDEFFLPPLSNLFLDVKLRREINF